MRSRILAAAAFAAVVSAPFLAPSAQAATCGTLTGVGTTELTSTGCSNGPVNFSDIDVKMSITGAAGGSLTSVDLIPVFLGPTGEQEYGLRLTFASGAGNGGGSVDIAWTYTVSANLLSDAYLKLTGQASGNGQIGVSETIQAPGIGPGGSDIVILSLFGAGDAHLDFNPVASAIVEKDEFAQTFPGGEGNSANTSILDNAFSVSQTPLPGALPLFAGGLGCLGLLARRRKQKNVTA